jgi:hypothetical protein
LNATTTLLKVLLTQQHLQRYETFCAEYEKVALKIAPELCNTAPSKAQYYRWLSGQLKGGVPYPDACRVLEGMFSPWKVSELFALSTPEQQQLIDPAIERSPLVEQLLTSVPHSFSANALHGTWLTCYQFGQTRTPKCHADIAQLIAESDRQIRTKNHPPEPRTESRALSFRTEIEAQLVSRHLIGHWKNTNDTRYFGSLHLAVLPGETVMQGYYTGFSNDIQVVTKRWKWVRLDPLSLSGIDLSEVRLREPAVLHALVEKHSQYDAPLTLNAVGEDF